ncbi:trk system potassium uptake protein TrkH [Dysgonomonas sp. PH5-45]|uniref:TrkH family potassium uptake protein n=1 Tax=unclassified Dysgonomonas TaxID=2630389 RepID=UPI002475936E|nr:MULTISPECIES: TrkH family potassium uptake protein [unclassified Dysgonomonas]MDH6353811.1 trk system potassium uptake protein TrkH [Dysgonomonas sp. PH5-45]MDH6386713.1 trk system potassium uptake protein TrkH [Dysgonomonas sp. PH5-37]
MNKFNLKFIFKTLGFLLIIESMFMMVSTVVSFYFQEQCSDWLLLSGVITIISGVFLRIIGTEHYEKPIGKRESFLVVALCWVVMSAFGMLPYYFSGVIPNVSDAFFETMSGFTTTGSTIILDIDSVPKGLLFWRSLTQWIGGIGIIVFALAFLPMIGGNASVLYDAETTGIVHERFRPRVAQIAKRIWGTYIAITVILCILLFLGPMNLFDSICHSLATLSTGGYSTKQASIAYWNSPYLEYVISVFMFIGGTNFALIFFLFKGKPQRLLKDEEFRWYGVICLIFIALISSCLIMSGQIKDVEYALRTSLFQVTSVITTTGFATVDYMNWGAFYTLSICLLMLFCACAGSTSGGVKIVRIIILCKNAVNEFKRQVHPNAILPVRLNGNVIPIEIVTKILAFIFLYLAILVVSFLVLSFTGMGFEESVGSAISCMGNVGPGLGSVGPSGHFADVPTFSKWYLCFLMMTGRLELFTVLSLFMPAFWKR